METNTRFFSGIKLNFPQIYFGFVNLTDCSLEYALETASLHPAKALGIEGRKGNLNFDCDADFVIMDPKTLKVVSTWIAGECVYMAPK